MRKFSELEGAILSEIALRGNDTAYKVRMAFQQSPSDQWSGSAGAVSPAIKRLTEEGHIAARPHERRRGLQLEITDKGRETLALWAADVETACGLGLDPFRLRSPLWQALEGAQRAALLKQLADRTAAQIDTLTNRTEDRADQEQTDLALRLLDARLQWIGDRLKR